MLVYSVLYVITTTFTKNDTTMVDTKKMLFKTSKYYFHLHTYKAIVCTKY